MPHNLLVYFFLAQLTDNQQQNQGVGADRMKLVADSRNVQEWLPGQVVSLLCKRLLDGNDHVCNSAFAAVASHFIPLIDKTAAVYILFIIM